MKEKKYIEKFKTIKRSKEYKFFYDWILPILVAIILAIFINKFIFFKAKIPSESMQPTLNKGDTLIINRVYDKTKLDRGDVIVFYSEELDELLIKRLIGLPGDKININEGTVEVNGEVLKEDYVGSNDKFSGEYIVPDEKYFFLGDNRAISKDSRKLTNPFIDSKYIEGKAILKTYPFNDFGVIK